MKHLKRFNESKITLDEFNDIKQMFLNISDEYDLIKLDDVNQNLYTVKNPKIWSINNSHKLIRLIIEIGINKSMFSRIEEFESDLDSFISRLEENQYRVSKTWRLYASPSIGIYTISIL